MKLPELVYQDESRNNRSCRVGDRDADPYAKCSEPSGKNQQAGNEEQHLPGERKEDRLLRPVSYTHLTLPTNSRV